MIRSKMAGTIKVKTVKKETFDRCLKLLENLTLAAERHDPTEIEASGGAARQFLDKLKGEE